MACRMVCLAVVLASGFSPELDYSYAAPGGTDDPLAFVVQMDAPYMQPASSVLKLCLGVYKPVTHRAKMCGIDFKP